MDQAMMRVRATERKFLKWGWWVFPLAGIVLAMLTGGGFWAWVEGQMPWLDWRQAFTLRGAVMAVAGMMLALLWRMLLWREWAGWMLTLSVVLGFVCAECAMRISPAQTAFWLATEFRIPAKANMSFQHDVCHVRLETAAMQQVQKPAIVVVGSSQVVEGIDPLLLTQLLPECLVVKRAVSSMRPLEALAAQQYIPIRQGDIVVHYLSEFDFTNSDAFPYAWFRPFASWAGWIDVLHATGWKRVLHDWRGGIDFALAATLELWRQRDWTRTGLFHIWSVPREDLVFDGKIPANRSGAWFAGSNRADIGGDFKVSQEQKRAMEKWIAHVAARGASVVVFEGQVNPDWRSLERQVLHDETAAWLTSFSSRGFPVRYVRMDEDFPEEDWKDHTHLNEQGREKLTREMGNILNSMKLGHE